MQVTLPKSLPLLVALFSGTVFAQDRDVFLINNSGKTSLTGFRIRGERGIYTALHGVLQTETGKQITATNAFGDVFPGLSLSAVDISNDLAVLSSPQLNEIADSGFDVAPVVDWTVVKSATVVGYPAPLRFEDIKKLVQIPQGSAIRPLSKMVDAPLLATLQGRQSPRPDTDVLVIDGLLSPGHSGAPVLDHHHRVIAVANGGIENRGHAWAIPLKGTTLTPANDAKIALNKLREVANNNLTGARPFAVAGDSIDSERLLSVLRDLTDQQRAALVDFTKAASELRALNLQGSREQSLSIYIYQLRVWMEKQPENPALNDAADRLDKIFERMESQYPGNKLPPVFNDAMLRAKIDLHIARRDWEGALKLANDEHVSTVKGQFELKRDEYVMLLQQRAEAFRGLHNWNKAIETYIELLNVRPRDTQGLVCLTEAHISLGQWEKAAAICDSIIEYYTASPIDRTSENNAAEKLALMYLKRALANEHFNRMEKALVDLESSTAILKRLVEEKKIAGLHYPSILKYRAEVEVRLEKLDDALTHITDAIDGLVILYKDPSAGLTTSLEMCDAYMIRAKLNRRLKKVDECLQDYADAYKVVEKGTSDNEQKQFALLLNNAGFAAKDFGKFELSARSYAGSAKVYSILFDKGAVEYADIRWPVANMEVLVREDKWDATVSELERVIKQKGEATSSKAILIGWRGILKLALGQRREGEVDLRDAKDMVNAMKEGDRPRFAEFVKEVDEKLRTQ